MHRSETSTVRKPASVARTSRRRPHGKPARTTTRAVIGSSMQPLAAVCCPLLCCTVPETTSGAQRGSGRSYLESSLEPRIELLSKCSAKKCEFFRSSCVVSSPLNNHSHKGEILQAERTREGQGARLKKKTKSTVGV